MAAFNLGVSEAVKVFPNIIRQSCNAATSFSKSNGCIMQGLKTIFFMFQEKLGTRPTEFCVSVAISFFLYIAIQICLPIEDFKLGKERRITFIELGVILNF